MRPARKFKRPASRFRKFAIGLGILLAGLIALALVLPGFIDWNRFKGEIEHQASSIIGRQLRIDGAIKFGLLPRPALSMEHVAIANSEGAVAPLMLSLERLEAKLAVLPLFSGKIQVSSFLLIAPVLNLESLPDGANNWTWNLGNPGAAQSAGPAVRFDQVRIEHGVIRYQNHISNAAIKLDKINVELSAGSLHGPYEARGSVRLQDVPLSLDAAIGAISPERATSLSVKLKAPGDVEAGFSGAITPQGEVTGALNSRGKDLNALMGSLARLGAPVLTGFQPALLQRPYDMQSALAVSAGKIFFSGIKLKLDENILTGSLLLENRETPAFEIIVKASSLDLDRLRAHTSPAAASASAPPAPFFPQFEMPRDVNGAVRIEANAVKLNGGLLRDINLAVTLSEGIASISEMRAQLPGSMAARISGKITTQSGQPNFTGMLDLKAENLRGLLGWLGVQLPVMPDRSLSRATLAGRLNLSPELAEMQEITAEIDSSKLTASLAVAFRERPALGIEVQLDQCNADNYFPQENTLVQNMPPADKPGADTAAQAAFDPGGWRKLLDGIDSNFKFSVDALTWRGVPISKLRADGAMTSGALAVNNFSVADIAGTAFSVSGILSSVSTAPQGEINLKLASNDLSGLARTLGVTLPVPGARLGKSSVEAKFLLAGEAVETVIDSRFDETSVLVSGGVSGFAPGIVTPAGTPTTMKLQLSLTNLSLVKFAAQAGLPLSPAAQEEQAGISLKAELISAPGEISLSALNGAIGSIPIEGQAKWRTTGPKPVLQAEFTAGEIHADNFLRGGQAANDAGQPLDRRVPWSGAPFELSFLDQFDAAVKISAARFSVNGFDFATPVLMLEMREGLASLKQFSGSLFGARASASASLRIGAAAPEFTASWQVEGADLAAASEALSGAPALTGSLDFSGQVKASGASSFALVSSLEGNAKATATNGFIAGLDLPAFSARLNSLERAADFQALADNILPSGKTPYQRIVTPFTISQGVAQSVEPVISIDETSGAAQISIDLPRYWLNAEASLTLNAHMQAPPLGIAYTGPLNNPERTLRIGRLENFFTQPLLSQSLQRVISNRTSPPAVTAPAMAPPQAPIPPPPQKENSAKKLFNGILDGIIGDKPK